MSLCFVTPFIVGVNRPAASLPSRTSVPTSRPLRLRRRPRVLATAGEQQPSSSTPSTPSSSSSTSSSSPSSSSPPSPPTPRVSPTAAALAVSALLLSVPTLLLQLITSPLQLVGLRPRAMLCRIWIRLSLLLAGIRVRATGRLPKGGSLLAANAASPLDALFVHAATGARALLPARALRLPFAGWALALGGHIGVNGMDRRALTTAISTAGYAIAAGVAVVVTPEGRRGAGGAVGRFLTPPFKAAGTCPVIPVAVKGGWEICQGGSVPLRGGVVNVDVLTQLQDGLSEKEAAARAFEAVCNDVPVQMRPQGA